MSNEKPSSSIRFPQDVEKHEIFPLTKTKLDKYEFSYCKVACAFGPKKYKDRPEWNHWGGFVINWGVKGFGFGELNFTLKGGTMNKHGELEGAEFECDSEAMSREFVTAALMEIAKTVKIT